MAQIDLISTATQVDNTVRSVAASATRPFGTPATTVDGGAGTRSSSSSRELRYAPAGRAAHP